MVDTAESSGSVPSPGLPFEDRHFDCLVCVDASNYFFEAAFLSAAVQGQKPSGRILLAESSTTFAEARQRLQLMAGLFR